MDQLLRRRRIGDNCLRGYLTTCLSGLGLLIASCTHPIDSPQSTQNLQTPAEYLKIGKNRFDEGRFAEAQRYLAEATRLNPDDQAARLLLGVTWAKLGNAVEARREFQKASEINAITNDGKAARSWLNRLQNPVVLAVFAFQSTGISSRYDIENLSYQSLHKWLFTSGLYSIVEERSSGYSAWRRGIQPIQACRIAGAKGAKIIILGVVDEFQVVRDRPPPIYLGGPGEKFSALILKMSVQMFAPSACQPINGFSRSAVRRQIHDGGRDGVIKQMVDNITRELALDIHSSLI